MSDAVLYEREGGIVTDWKVVVVGRSGDVVIVGAADGEMHGLRIIASALTSGTLCGALASRREPSGA